MTTQYRTEKYGTHEKLAEGLNKLAADGWELVTYAVQTGYSMSSTVVHFVILRRCAQDCTCDLHRRSSR